MYAGFVKSKNIEPIPAASPPGVAPRSIPDNRHITFLKNWKLLLVETLQIHE